MLCATTTSHDVSEQPPSFLPLKYTYSRPCFLVSMSKTGEHGKQVCPISVPSHHLESKGVLHNTFTRTQGYVHGKMMKHDKHMYFWNVTQLPTFVSQSLLFSAEFLTPSSRSRLSRTPLPGSNHIPPTTMTSRWIMESFLLQTGSSSELIMPVGGYWGR